ncbi:hypothetical protein [Streptomyces purpureus]|nr:hypothetical protein [Streptomyces purpureus]
METRTVAIVCMLNAAIEAKPSITDEVHHIRIEAAIPDDLSSAGRQAILVALGHADRYGHHRAPDRAFVWAELDKDVRPVTSPLQPSGASAPRAGTDPSSECRLDECSLGRGPYEIQASRRSADEKPLFTAGSSHRCPRRRKR